MVADSLVWLAMVEDFLVRLAVGCGIYRSSIGFLTGATSALVAAVLLYLHHRVLPEEKWIKFLGWAYGLFFLQYSIPAVAAALTSWGFAENLKDTTQALAQALLSPANNLCFLAAALVLLGWRAPRPWERRASPKDLLPWWVVAVALISALLLLGHPNAFLFRLPDALLSASCLGLLGVGMWQNSAPQSHRFLASANLVGPACYGLVNLLFSLNPLVLKWDLWPDLEAKLQNAISGVSQVGFPADFVENLRPLTCTDSTIDAVAFFLKISLFLGTLLLIIRRLLLWSPESGRGLLDRITFRRGRFLSAEGVLKALAGC